LKSSTPHEYFDWQEHLEPAIKIMIEGIMIVDVEGRIVYVNDSAERMLGRDKSEIIGRSFRDPVWSVETPEGLPFPEENRPFTRVMRENKPVYGIEVSVLHPDETRRLLSFSAIPLRDETGALIASVQTFSDITERKKTEEELLFKSLLLDSATDAIIVHDFEGNILYANEAAYKNMGLSKEELLSMSLYEWVAPEARKRIKPNLERIIKAGRAIFESADIKKDGTVFPVEVHSRVIKFRGKSAIAGIIRDITDRKWTEQEIIASAQALEEKDTAIRRAYVDVIGAVTGGKLVLMTQEEIENALGSPLIESQTIASSEDLAVARQTEREVVGKVFPDMDTDKFIVAVSEALTNAIKHSESGTYRLFKAGPTLQAVISDTGAGIDFTTLPKATLTAGFSTKGSLGMGFSIMLEVCDRVLLATQPGNTIVVLEIGS
jgi:PAS domain S-box-containing protein